MKFTISRSLNNDKIIFIARDAAGIVRIRANTLEEMEATIKELNKKEVSQSKPIVRETSKKEVVKDETESKEEETEVESKEFLQNDLKAKVQTRKKEQEKKSSRKSFWDKLR